jgi:SecD/SecF fusion protein
MKTTRCIASVVLAVTLIACLGCKARQGHKALVYAFDIPAGQKGPGGRQWKPDIDQAVATIERRINGVGHGNKAAGVRRVNDTTLEVCPWTTDPAVVAKIDRLVTRLGSLEFRILANDRDNPGIIEKSKAVKPDVDKLYSAQGKIEAWWVPVDPKSGKELKYPEIARRTVTKNGQPELQVLVVADPFNVTGAYLTYVAADVDQRGRPDVIFQFNSIGAKKFGGLTSTHLPDDATGFTRKLGIILDNKLFSAPSIQSMIRDRGEITGSFTRNDVDDMVAVLNAGALPAPLKKISERTGML